MRLTLFTLFGAPDVVGRPVVGRPAAGAGVGHAAVEFLEPRRLLSTTGTPSGVAAGVATVAPASADVASPAVPQDAAVARYYGGTLSFGRVAGQPRRPARDVVVNVTSADAATGQVAGTLAAAGLGNVGFTGQLRADDAFVLTTTGDLPGTLTGRLARGGTRMSGVLAAADGSTARVTARALTPVGTAAATGGNGSAQPLNFSGSSTGTASLRQRADAPAVSTATGTSTPAAGATTATATAVTATTTNPATIGGRQTLDLTLDITGQNADRTLVGTLNAGTLGTYNVAGAATGNQLTLVVTPPAAAGGSGSAAVAPAGILRLTATGNGTRFVGRFEQATSGVFGVGRINLARVATGTAVGSTPGSTVGTGVGAGLQTDGSVVNLDGSLLRPDGTLIAPDGTVLRVGTGTGGTVGTVGAIGTATGATGASATNSPIGVVGTAPGATGATTANGLFGPIGTAPGGTAASVTNGTTFGLSPATPGSTGAFTGLGAPGTITSAGTALGTPIYTAGSTSLGSPIYTFSPVGSPANTGTAIGSPAYVGSPFGSSLGTTGTIGSAGGFGGTGRVDGFDVVGGTSAGGGDVLLAGQLGGAYGTAFNSTGSIFAG